MAEKVAESKTTEKGVGEVSKEQSVVVINEKVNTQNPLQSPVAKGKLSIWDLIKV